jgi:hypothetical protein
VDLAHGGFVVEFGDSTQYDGFAAFQRHLRDATISQRWEKAEETLHLGYRSGEDEMQMGFRPRGADAHDRRSPAKTFVYRRVNGTWPYLHDGVERDTPLSQQSRTGTIKKGGAVLRTEPGRSAYLLADPRNNSFMAWNPLPDPTHMRLDLPGGAAVEANGRLSICRLIVKPEENRLAVDYATKPGQDGEEMATHMIVSGLDRLPPKTTVNGHEVSASADIFTLDDARLCAIPLTGPGGTLREPGTRLRKARRALAEAEGTTIRDVASLRYESGHENYFVTEPRSGHYELQRLWPSPSVLEARVGTKLRVVIDGRIGARRLILSARDNRVVIDAPEFFRHPRGKMPEDPARAALIFGRDERPTVEVNGQVYQDRMPRVEIRGEKAWLVPLYDTLLEDATRGISGRYDRAMGRLAD